MANGTILEDESNTSLIQSGYAFQQTPKYNPDSTDQSTMARFYIEDTLKSAIEEMYKGQTSAGTVIKSLLDKLSSEGGYIDFLLSSVRSEERDRYFLSETLGRNFTVFGMGKSPEVISGGGVLKNTQEDDWQVQFLEFFNKIGGVNALAKLYQYAPSSGVNNKNFLTFKYNNRWVEGALLSVSTSLDAKAELDIVFSFTFLVTKVNEAINRELGGSFKSINSFSEEADTTSNQTTNVNNSGSSNVFQPSSLYGGTHTNSTIAPNVAISNSNMNDAKQDGAITSQTLAVNDYDIT